MKAFKFLGLGLVIIQAAFLMSCGQANNNGAGRCDNRNAAGCGGNAATATNTDITLSGLFYGTDQNQFQINAAGLASATVAADALGTVSDGQTQDNTGIAFGGRVALSSGKFTTGAAANTQVAGTSRLLVAIYDSLVGQTTTTGQVIGPIQIPMSSASGTVGGNVADVSFKDDFGSIRFQGNYDATNFTGTVTFNNTTVVGGSSATTGSFNFRIPTCSFFACN